MVTLDDDIRWQSKMVKSDGETIEYCMYVVIHVKAV